jgi:hypothetical protein
LEVLFFMAMDYIPSIDGELATYATNLGAYVVTNFAAIGISVDDKALIDTKASDYADALTAHLAAQTAARSAKLAKDALKADLKTLIRSQVRIIQANPTTSDAQRAEMAITIPDRVPTAIVAPLTAPVLAIDTSQRGEHRVSFRDESTPFSKAKPDGVMGCDIYRKVSDVQPAGTSVMEYLGCSSATPARFVYEESQYGSQVWYVAQWRTQKGLTGALSQYVSATVVK